jgi:hypothetical protein
VCLLPGLGPCVSIADIPLSPEFRPVGFPVVAKHQHVLMWPALPMVSA